MKQIFIQLLILILGINITFGQSERKRANYWHFGSKAALDFSCLPPESFSGSELSSGEGSASISDLDGNLMMYTNGQTVWDANNNVMPNGTGLLGHVSTVQSAVIIPKPGDPTIYYIFTGGTSIEDHGQIGVHYSEVDMTLNGGMGDVTGNKNTFLFNPNEEKLTAVTNGAGNGYWVVAQKYHSAEWYAYEVTSAGVNTTPVISTTGPIARFENSLDAKLSPDGTMLASQNQCNDNYNPSICLYSFNNTTGMLNFLWEDCGGAGPSLEFSPDATKLYAATHMGINQYDLTAGAGITDGTAIIASKTTIMTPTGGIGSSVSMQLANDCKIYVSQGGLASGAASLSVIDKPNLAGAACNYIVGNTELVSGNCFTRLTNFVTSFFYEGCPDLAFDLNVTNAECQADGAIDLVITGGTPPFYYDWSNGAATQDVAGLNGGWYSVTVTDDFGNCVKDSAYVEQNQQTVSVVETLTHPTTCGSTDGAIDLVITPAGGGPEDILTEDFETDGEGSRYNTIGLQDPGTNNKFFKRGIAGNFNWFGASTLSGQNGDYCFAVRNPGNSPVSLTLNPAPTTGYYDLNVCILLAAIGNPKANDFYRVEYQMDGGGWVKLTEFRRSSPPYKLSEDTNGDGIGDGIQLTDIFQDFCFSIPATGNNLEIKVISNSSGSTSGFAFDYIRLTGIPPLTYTIAWTPDGETTASINDKSTGTYDVEITTSTGCVVTESYSLHDPCSCTPPALQINPLYACLPYAADLYDAIDPASDAATLTFHGSENNANNAAFAIGNIAITGGSYWVRAEDPNDPTCFAVYEIQLVYTEVTFTTNITHPNCGENDGEIVIVPGPEFNITNYSIDNGVTTQAGDTFTNLSEGTYTILISDDTGCTATGTVNLSNSGSTDNPSFTISDFCEGATNHANITGTQGGTFSIVSPTGDGATINSSTGEISNAVGGTTYIVQYTTSSSCPVSETHSVTVNVNPTYSVTTTDPSCGNNDGEIVITPDAGVTLTDYSIDNGTTTQSGGVFSNLETGTYAIYVKDNNGCEATGTEILNNVDAPKLTIVDTEDVSCFDGSDGNAEVSVTGGTPAYTYNWSPLGGNAPSATDLAAGLYTVTVTDQEGCSSQVQITISEPDLITLNETITHATCGNDNGEITLNVTGGTGNYTYTWNPNVSATNQATNIAVGSYEVNVTDENECSQTVTYTINSNDSFFIEATPDEVTITQGESASLDVFVDPNVTVNSILWTPSNGLSCITCADPMATPDATTTYYVTVTDDNGCTATDSVRVVVKSPCEAVAVPTIFTPNADGLHDLQCVLGSCITSLDFIIFNRWGQVVFRTVDQNECWDGTFKGKPVEGGTYVYKLNATLESGDEVRQTGNVTVIR